MTVALDIGFVPLTDAASLIVAKALGYDLEEGIELHLHREVSWSNIRDKVAVGVYPAAHMLAPMALAMSLGQGQMTAAVSVPMMLSQNGNTLTTHADLAEQVGQVSNLSDLAKRLHTVVKRPLRIGVPFPHSMHLLLTQFWLDASLPKGKARAEFVIAPPSKLVDVLASGEIDAFMVGEPYGSQATEDGAVILSAACEIWSAAPEKVLGVNRIWAEQNSDQVDALVRALVRASFWCGNPANAEALADILSMPHYLGVSADIVVRALTGHLVMDRAGSIYTGSDIMRLSGMDVLFPWNSKAQWIAEQAASHWGISVSAAELEATRVFRPDILRRALAGMPIDLPVSDSLAEGGNADMLFVKGAESTIPIGPNRFFSAK